MVRLHDVLLPQPPAGMIADKPTLAALKAHADLVQRTRAEHEAIDAATRKVGQAREADRANLAVALREGRDDPGTAAVAEAEQAVEDATRKADALALAALAARDEVAAIVQKRRATLLEQATARTDNARDELRNAMRDLRAAIEAFAQASNAELWCKRFPESPGTVGAVRLLGLTAPNGETRTIDEVLSALEIYVAGA